jgi:hypothetical protein
MPGPRYGITAMLAGSAMVALGARRLRAGDFCGHHRPPRLRRAHRARLHAPCGNDQIAAADQAPTDRSTQAPQGEKPRPPGHLPLRRLRRADGRGVLCGGAAVLVVLPHHRLRRHDAGGESGARSSVQPRHHGPLRFQCRGRIAVVLLSNDGPIKSETGTFSKKTARPIATNPSNYRDDLRT